MSVRAKFRVVSLKQTHLNMSTGTEIGTVVELLPVTSGSDENKEFYKWTPSGKIELGTLNESAAKAFEIGKEYYVDFNCAE